MYSSPSLPPNLWMIKVGEISTGERVRFYKTWGHVCNMTVSKEGKSL